jgi:hypothetical protein
MLLVTVRFAAALCGAFAAQLFTYQGAGRRGQYATVVLFVDWASSATNTMCSSRLPTRRHNWQCVESVAVYWMRGTGRCCQAGVDRIERAGTGCFITDPTRTDTSPGSSVASQGVAPLCVLAVTCVAPARIRCVAGCFYRQRRGYRRELCCINGRV